MDEGETPVFTGTAYRTTSNRVVFGVNGATPTQSIYYDYLCYRTHAAAAPAGASATVVSAKLSGNATSLKIPANVVSAVFLDYLYIQSPDGLPGLRVNKASHGRSVGDAVDVFGTMATNSDGERYVAASTVSKVGSGVPHVTGMRGSSLGGSDLSYNPSTGARQRGKTNGTGPNNVGLRVRVWGKVTQRDTVGLQYFYIDDGSGARDGTLTGMEENTGVRVKASPIGYASGDYVTVDGISCLFKDGSGSPWPQVLPPAVGGIQKLWP